MGWFFLLLTILLGCTGADAPASAAAAPTATPEPSVASEPTVATPPAVADPAPPVTPPTPAIQADLHVDTPTQMYRKKVGLDGPGLESGLEAMRAGGTNLAVMVAWPPRDVDGAAHVEKLLSIVEGEDARLDAVTTVRTPADARRVIAAGGVALALSVEGSHGLLHPGEAPEAGLSRLDALHARGLAMLGLTWSFSTPYAGSSGDAEPGTAGTGLTDAGRALVARANDLGVVVDVSHASRAATLEACAASRAPVIASHSDAAAVRAHARNLTDPEIDCIARSGGVIGVNLHASFVGKPATAARVADHLDHLRARGGIGVVALGSDYDGIITPPDDLPDASALGRLWEELRRRGWSEEDLAAVRGENFLRAWQAVLDAAARR